LNAWAHFIRQRRKQDLAELLTMIATGAQGDSKGIKETLEKLDK
jgi:hypothetical protein